MSTENSFFHFHFHLTDYNENIHSCGKYYNPVGCGQFKETISLLICVGGVTSKRVNN